MTINNLENDEDDIPYDLFISHYQKTGGNLALLIKNYLKEQNLEIFLDVDDMRSTHNLEKNIENSENILLLITNNVFERYYVQLELKNALKFNKNIIVLWDKKNCDFPKKEEVDDDLIPILYITAITWANEIYLREPILNEIKKYIKIKSEEEKFLELLNKKINYKQIISSSYIKKYLNKKRKTTIDDFDKIKICDKEKNYFDESIEIIERKKTIITNHNFYLLIFAIINRYSKTIKSELIQKDVNEILLCTESGYDSWKFIEKINVKKIKNKVSLTLILICTSDEFYKYTNNSYKIIQFDHQFKDIFQRYEIYFGNLGIN